MAAIAESQSQLFVAATRYLVHHLKSECLLARHRAALRGSLELVTEIPRLPRYRRGFPFNVRRHGSGSGQAHSRNPVEWPEFQTLERLCEGVPATTGTTVTLASGRAEFSRSAYSGQRRCGEPSR